jgi:hypothetical protein
MANKMDIRFLLMQIFPDVSERAVYEGMKYIRLRYKLNEEAVVTMLFAEYQSQRDKVSPRYAVYDRKYMPGEASLRRARFITNVKTSKISEREHIRHFDFTMEGQSALNDIYRYFEGCIKSGY